MNSTNTFKKWGVLLAMMFFAGFAFAQPSNDLCSDAEDIDCGDVVQGTTISSTFDNVGTCGTSNTAAGVWYAIPGTGSAITMSTCNQASYDTKISVFTGNSCSALTCVGGQDDASGCSGFTTEYTFNSSASDDYYVLIHGFSSNTGNFTLSATCAAPPTGNDGCSGADPLACGTSATGSTANATQDNAPFCGTSNTANGVWYEITPNVGDVVTISTDNPGTNYDTKLTVYTGGCGVLNCVDGNDDGGTGLTSELSFCADGSTYLVLVHGFGSSSGDYEVSATCAPGATNDEACDAVALTAGTAVSFNNQCATAATGEPTPGGGTGSSSCDSQDGWCSFETDVDNTLWYSFVAPASGCVSIETDGFDTQVAVYSASDCSDYGTFTALAANDDGGPGLASLIDGLACLTPGATYYVQVDGYNGASGDGTITMTDCGNDPLAVDAGECQSSFIGYAPAEGPNYLYATGSGGIGGLTYSWSGPDILYTDGDKAAVQPTTLGTNTYYVTVTDEKGCTSTDSVTVEVIDVVCVSSSSGSGRGRGSSGSNSSSGSGCVSNAAPIFIQMCVACGSSSGSGGRGRGHGSDDDDDGGSGSSSGSGFSHNSSSGSGQPCFRERCVKVDSRRDRVADLLAIPGNSLGPCGNTCTATNPAFDPPPVCVDLTVTIVLDNFPSETSWELVDSSGNVIAGQTQGFYSGMAGDTVSESICVDPRDCYTATIFDSFGDGICCTFGSGTWSVTYDSMTVVSPLGGNFGNSESISVGACAASKTGAAPAASLEQDFALTAFPNPFSQQATIKFKSPITEHVSLIVYDMNGNKVSLLYDDVAEAGVSVLTQLDGSQLNSGIYFYRLTTESGQVETGKLVLQH